MNLIKFCTFVSGRAVLLGLCISLSATGCSLTLINSSNRKLSGAASSNVASFNVSSVTLSEGSGSTIAIGILTSRSVDTVFNLSLTNNAGGSTSADFNAVSATATILAGQTSVTVNLQSIADTTYELTKNFTLAMSTTDTGVSILNASIPVTLNDNDAAPVVTMASPSQNINEGTASGTIAVQLSNASYESIVVP